MPKVYLPLFIEWTEKYVFKAPMFWSTFSSVFYSEWNIAEICNGFSTLFYILDSCHYVLQLALCVRACVCGCARGSVCICLWVCFAYVCVGGRACAWECVSLFVRVFCVMLSHTLVSRHSGVHFNSQAIAPTIEQIDQSFGATHPGGKQQSIHILSSSSSYPSPSSSSASSSHTSSAHR